jgi:dihydropteroate synthase
MTGDGGAEAGESRPGPAARPPGQPPGPRLRGLPSQPRSLVMGVVNVTPDSFSDGGAWLQPAAAIAHGLELAGQGADIIDVGGESTRPGAERVPMAEELDRVMPVITALAAAGSYVSVDTMRAEVASQALRAGASMVNDVSGGLADPGMAGVVAAAGVPYIMNHWRGHSSDMYGPATYNDVVAEVRGELALRVKAAVAGGVDPAQIVVDPGLGFAKRAEHNWILLGRLDRIGSLPGFEARFPVLVAASRKRFIGRLLSGPDGEPRSFVGSDEATIAITALAAAAGVWCVRVHVVPGNLDAVRVAARWRQAVAAGSR